MTIVNHLLNGTDIQGTSLYLASLLQKEAPNFDRTRASKYFAFPSLTPLPFFSPPESINLSARLSVATGSYPRPI